MIPMKDAAILARAPDREFRRAWRQRIVDHDGDAAGEGGIVRRILIENAEPAEFGQLLFLIEP